MRTGVRAYRRTGVRGLGRALARVGRRTRGAILLALGPAVWAGHAAAQRIPEGAGPAVTWPAGVPGPVALRPTAAASPWASAATPLSATPRDSGPTAGLFVAEVVTGAVGFAAGFYGGAVAGGRSCSVVGDCTGEDPGLGRAIVGALAGSWLGTALGSHIGGGIVGGPTGPFGARLVAAAGGLLVGLGVSAFVHPDLDRPASYIAVPVVAAAVTSLAVRRR